MWYTEPVVKRGLILSGQGYGAYGLYWKPPLQRLAKCEEMRDWYDKFVAIKAKYKADCKWPRMGSCGKPKRKLMNEYERRGKAAWRECKLSKRSRDAEAMQADYEAGMNPWMSEGGAMTDSQVGFRWDKDHLYIPNVLLEDPPPPPGPDEAAEAEAAEAEMDQLAKENAEMDAEIAAENQKKLLMYGGIAAGALLLIIALRR